MFYTTNPIIKHKACLPNLAEELTNVPRVCRIIGSSRWYWHSDRQQNLLLVNPLEMRH